MRKSIPFVLVTFILLIGIALAASGTMEVISYIVGNVTTPSRADAGNVNMNERFDWFIIEVHQPTIPMNITWINGTNVECVHVYVQTPSDERLKLSHDPVDRITIEQAEVGNYSVYAKANAIGDVKGFIRVECSHCNLIDIGKW